VPLIKLDGSGVALDLSVASDGVFKSRVLGAAADAQPAYRSLVRLVKAWARQMRLNDPAAGGLNSFALSLIALFHCQRLGLLPPLAALLLDQPQAALAEEAARARAGDARPGPLRAACDACRDADAVSRRAGALAPSLPPAPPLPALLASFFAHWAAAREALRGGASLRPFSGGWGAPGAWASRAYPLCVEDPFNAAENPARSLGAGAGAGASRAGATPQRLEQCVAAAAAALAAPPADLRHLAAALFGDPGALQEGHGPLAPGPPPPAPPPAGRARRGGAAPRSPAPAAPPAPQAVESRKTMTARALPAAPAAPATYHAVPPPPPLPSPRPSLRTTARAPPPLQAAPPPAAAGQSPAGGAAAGLAKTRHIPPPRVLPASSPPAAAPPAAAPPPSAAARAPAEGDVAPRPRRRGVPRPRDKHALPALPASLE